MTDDIGKILKNHYGPAMERAFERSTLLDALRKEGSSRNKMWTSPFYHCPLLNSMFDRVRIDDGPLTVRRLIRKLRVMPQQYFVRFDDYEMGEMDVCNVRTRPAYRDAETVVVLES